MPISISPSKDSFVFKTTEHCLRRLQGARSINVQGNQTHRDNVEYNLYHENAVDVTLELLLETVY